jgi:EmrB/QacA subfamily drug resistance transporter
MSDVSADTKHARRWAILSAVMLGSVMGPIDSSVINVTLPVIAQSFHAPMAVAQWVPMLFLLLSGSLLLFYGRLGDILGYKRVYLAGLAGFAVASGLRALAPTIGWLIALRALQGLAAGMMSAVPSAILTASFPPEERGKALGINALSISAGLAIGPSLGGFITSALGWRQAFLINLPIGVASFFLASRLLPEWKGQPAQIDAWGALTAFLSLFCVLFFANRFPTTGWTYTTGAVLLVAVVAGAAFLRREATAPQPMLNLDLFRNATFAFANVGALLSFMSQYVLVFLTPFYLQRVLRFPVSRAGLVMTAFPLATMTVAPVSGALSDRIGTRRLACLGAAVCAAALVSMSLLPASATWADVVWRLALFGLGTGMFQSPNNSAVMGSVARPNLGVASGILGTTRSVGMVLGIATGGAVFYALTPSQIVQKAVLMPAEAAVFLAGLRPAYLVGAALATLAALASLIRGSRLSLHRRRCPSP